MNFYPRPLRGGRCFSSWVPSQPRKFLSTPSARRATRSQSQQCDKWIISIHTLREEGDWVTGRPRCSSFYFYPRPPHGGRRRRKRDRCGTEPIPIHALREEGDHPVFLSGLQSSDFYPRFPQGKRPRQRVSIRYFMALFLSMLLMKKVIQFRQGQQ